VDPQSTRMVPGYMTMHTSGIESKGDSSEISTHCSIKALSKSAEGSLAVLSPTGWVSSGDEEDAGASILGLFLDQDGGCRAGSRAEDGAAPCFESSDVVV
jgi:hypothetical protein